MQFQDSNVLLIIHQGALGGAERQALGISRILSEKYNCQIDLLLTYSEEMTEDFAEFAKQCKIRNIWHFGASYLYCPTEFSLKNLRRFKWSVEHLFLLRSKLVSYKYDIIIPFLNFPSKLSFFLYKLLPSVKFTFWHQLGLDKWNHDIFERVAARNIPCVIANSETGLEMFSEHYKKNSERLFILPQYVSLEFSEMDKDYLYDKYSISKGAVVIGMVAHFREDKYHELLIQVFFKLQLKYSKIHLVLLGHKKVSSQTASKFLYLQQVISELNLETKVSLLSEKRVEEVLNVFDIGVLISKIEGMPNSVMEYMLYRLPVVATGHPGCRQLLGDSPFLVENNENEIYNALEELIVDEDLRRREGFNNKKKIESFDMESYIYNLEKIISTVNRL